MKILSRAFYSICCASLFFWQPGSGQELASYYSRYQFLPTSASVSEGDLVGFANPATIGLISGFQSRLYWIAERENESLPKSWGLYSAVPGLGFSVQRDTHGPWKTTDYQFATGFGNRAASFGMGYQWSRGHTDLLGRENLFSIGFILRPSPYLSIGTAGRLSTESSAKEANVDIGLRPFGSETLTLFADAAIQKEQSIGDAPWSIGGNLQLLQGIFLSGRYFEDESFTLGIQLAFGRDRSSTQFHFNDRQKRAYNSYSVGFGDYHPHLFQSWFQKGKRMAKLNMKGRVDYQKYLLFDEGTRRFADILENIQNAAADDRVGLIALNLSGMRIRPELAWELREALRGAQQSGKKVIVFIDNVRMTHYHLASVADRLVIDPQGMILLPGLVMGRTYFKATLEKLGLGFDEWRFFKYKSAAETLSRDHFSEADKEQFQAYVDDWYETIRADVSKARGFSAETFDQLVNDGPVYLPAEALEKGLVDTLGRWSDLEQFARSLTGQKMAGISHRDIRDRARFYGKWGEPKRIALVYALGECAMDTGIRARWLSKKLLGLAKDRSIEAVVFRVDSPGGDGMASDIVAEALKKVSEKKPVVVSQGQVAGSGGYWISMYGDTIVAGPNTITGSIGVIGGWVYDKGLSGKLGMSSDYVKRGKHAEVGFGIRLPFINAQVPSRNLTEDERARVEEVIRTYYQDFLGKVAAGRGFSIERADSLGQGRFYSGTEGHTNGLVDEIGGLLRAIALARQMAGIPAGEKINLVEIPRYKGLWDSNLLSPVGLGSIRQDDPVLQYLKLLSERPGHPLPMLIPGSYPDEE